MVGPARFSNICQIQHSGSGAALKKTTLMMSMTADKIPKLSKLSVSCLVRTSGLDLSKTCAIQLKTLKPFFSNDLHSMTVLLSLEGDKLK